MGLVLVANVIIHTHICANGILLEMTCHLCWAFDVVMMSFYLAVVFEICYLCLLRKIKKCSIQVSLTAAPTVRK